MAENVIFQLTSGEGFGAVIHGNFVSVCIGYQKIYASVSAFLLDANHQYQGFDSVDEAVAWAAAVAETHQGQAREISRINYWEIRKGYSITVESVESGGYEAELHPMWFDSDPGPIRVYKTFPDRDEAIAWAREEAEQQRGRGAEYQQKLQQIRASLEAHAG